MKVRSVIVTISESARNAKQPNNISLSLENDYFCSDSHQSHVGLLGLARASAECHFRYLRGSASVLLMLFTHR